MFGDIVYLLCTATSTACAVLLLRGYRRSGARLLLWSAVCFAGLALNNVLLIIDLRVAPWADLSSWRLVPAILGAGALLHSLIWEVR